MNEKFFVFYNDGYCEDGDKDLAEFDTEEQAAKFITQRMSEDTTRTLENYRVIKGHELSKNPVEVITKIILSRHKAQNERQKG